MNNEMKPPPSEAPEGRVAVVGLGYVGLTLAVVAADAGYHLLGIERRQSVVSGIKQGQAHFFEVGLGPSLGRHVASGRLMARREFLPTDRCSVYIITVGTPIGADRRTKTDAIISVARTIKARLQPNDLVILRSTVRVGVTREIVKPILDQAAVPYYLAFCPERTIEGKALQELAELPQIVGGIDAASAKAAAAFFSRIAHDVVELQSVEAAELVKLINNTERDLRFAFANEIAAMCDVLGLVAHDIIDACNHRYPRSNLALPGPVGGPCLTKDPYILAEGLQTHGLEPRLALVGRETNEAVIGNAVALVHDALCPNGSMGRVKRVAVLGLAFKGRPETDDLRGSTALDLQRALRQRFPEARLVGYDPVISLPEIEAVGFEPVSSIDEAFAGTSAVFLHNNHRKFENLPLERLCQTMTRPGIIYDFWGQNRASAGLVSGVHVAGLGFWPKAAVAATVFMTQPSVA